MKAIRHVLRQAPGASVHRVAGQITTCFLATQPGEVRAYTCYPLSGATKNSKHWAPEWSVKHLASLRSQSWGPGIRSRTRLSWGSASPSSLATPPPAGARVHATLSQINLKKQKILSIDVGEMTRGPRRTVEKTTTKQMTARQAPAAGTLKYDMDGGDCHVRAPIVR